MRIGSLVGNMSKEEMKQKKAREMRYKKPIVKDLNLDSIKQYLWEIQEECDNARWCYDDEDTLIDALDGDEEEAYELRMMFSDLSAECERMQDDLNNWSYIDKLEELFDLFFVAVGAGNDFGGLLGYDTYEQDYFGLDAYISSEWVEEESRKKIERMTKKDIMDIARLSFRIYQSFIALRYRHDCLKASLDILRDKNTGHLQMIKQFEELYEKVDKETNGFKYNWKDSVKELDRVLDAMPQEVWLW